MRDNRIIAHRRSGMTLVEVLAVVVILGLVAATLAVGFGGAFGQGKREIARTQIATISQKLEAYKITHDSWPEVSIGLDAMTDGIASPSASYYLSEDQLLDPWKRRFLLIVPGPDGHPYELVSYGADGQPGGEGEDADLSSVRLRDE